MSDAADTAVLIVEDEALIAMLMADTLAGAGYGPVWIPDGRAPSTMRRTPPARLPPWWTSSWPTVWTGGTWCAACGTGAERCRWWS